MISLDTLDAVKVAEHVNKAAGSIVPHIPIYGYADFTIIGHDAADVEQVRNRMKPLIDSRVSVSGITVKAFEAHKSSLIWGYRVAVMLLDYVRLGTMSIIELESNLAYTRKCCTDDGWKIEEDDLMINMQGARFYKR